MDRIVAQGYFGILVSQEIRQKGLKPAQLAKDAEIHPAVVENVTSGKAELCRETELRKLITVLFLARSKRREKAYRLLVVFMVSRKPVCTQRYNNRHSARRGKYR